MTEDLLSLVLADLDGTPVRPAEIRLVVVDPRRPEVSNDLLGDDASAWLDAGDEVPQILLRIGSNVTAVGGTDRRREQLIVEIAGLVQEAVMDRLNAPWPVLRSEHGEEVVLEPRVNEVGEAVWAGKSLGERRIGRLRAAPEEP